MTTIKIYEIERAYIDYLRAVDPTVSKEKDHFGAKSRKYIGILFEINGFSYFAPLASPKPKFQKMKNGKDFMKINGGVHGAINFNNMIPVHESAIIHYDIQKEEDLQYQVILKDQAIFIRKHSIEIIKVANDLYILMTGSDKDNESERNRLRNRCCNYQKLEAACSKYQEIGI